jgi:hypothetical protein
MYMLVMILNLFPAGLVITSYFFIQPEIFPVLLLLLKIYDARVESEDLSRIEHKLDCFYTSMSETQPNQDAYSKIHRTAWEHEPPMVLDQQTVELGKKRGDIIAVVSLFNGAVFYIFSAVWMYSLFAGH